MLLPLVPLVLATGLVPAWQGQFPALRAVRADHPISVDGVLDEDVWKQDSAVTAFTQREPDEGAAPRQRTELRIAYDDDAIYFGIRCWDTAADSIVAALVRRDNDVAADRVLVFLDPFHDRRTGYYFAVNAAGVEYDGTLMNDDWDDSSWDGVWHAHVQRDAQGWSAEIRIPYSQLRFNSSEHMVWGVNCERDIPRYDERDELAFAPRGQSGFVSRFPDLTGLEGVHTGRRYEVMPYATTKAEYLVHTPGDPFHNGSRYTPAGGGDLRTSLGSNLTLNATVNPDFGQVEIDPAVVNLSDVETYFQEKRPFFTDGLAVFRCGNNGASDYWGFNWSDPTFFYTRRIGRAPESNLANDADYSDVPAGTHILGAAKITGQPAPGWNFGTLHALTARETGHFDFGGVQSQNPVEPLSYYGVWRGMKEFHDRRQGLGLMTTSAFRFFDGDSSLSGQINRTGVVTALDGWSFFDRKRVWVISGWAAATNVTGTAERMTALQENAQHYFQRPDVGYLGVDPNATSMTGYGARAWVNKQSGNLLFNSAFGFLSPKFDNNDMGFLSRADLVNMHLGTGWQWTRANHWMQNANVITALASSWDFGGDNIMKGYYLGTNITQRNRWNWSGNVFFLGPALDSRRTRGGPLMASKPAESMSLFFSTNTRQKFSWSLSANPNLSSEGTHELSLNPAVTWKAAPNLSFQLSPGIDQLHSDAQYVTTQLDPLAVQTFGGRYVFARLDQTTVSAELRMDLSMTPNLSLQLYAQPLVSSGRYTNYKELARARTYDFLVYGQDGSTFDPVTRLADPDGPGPAPPVNVGSPDFTFRSVRGNAVLRWEYMPGSTVYLVWTQERSASVGDGTFDLHTSLAELARTPANDIFLVKVSHHFDM